MLLKESEVDIRLLNIYQIKITSLLPLSSDIATLVDILQLWVQSILPNQQPAGGDMNTVSEDRNCFLWVASVVVLSISLVILERLLSVAPL